MSSSNLSRRRSEPILPKVGIGQARIFRQKSWFHRMESYDVIANQPVVIDNVSIAYCDCRFSSKSYICNDFHSVYLRFDV